MNVKAFFVDALTSALELEIGTPDDVLRHVTPDVLAAHLPRPLWARLLTAALGAPRVDARLIVETIGIPNLCEHVPAAMIWSCISDIGTRSLGKQFETAVPAPVAKVSSGAVPTPIARGSSGSVRTGNTMPPPDTRSPAATPPAAVPSIAPAPPQVAAPAPVNQPLADLISEMQEGDAGEPKFRPRSPTAQRFRQTGTAMGRLGAGRRPQVPAPPSRRPETSEPEPAQARADVDSVIAVDDSQLVDWQATDGAGITSLDTEDFSDLGRKR